MASGVRFRFLASAGCVVLSFAAYAQDNPTGSLKCVVVDDIGGQPVSGARLMLTGGKLDAPLAGIADSAGSFTFTGLAAARYSLTVERSGFFPRSAAAPQDGGQVGVDAGLSDTTARVTLIKIRTIRHLGRPRLHHK